MRTEKEKAHSEKIYDCKNRLAFFQAVVHETCRERLHSTDFLHRVEPVTSGMGPMEANEIREKFGREISIRCINASRKVIEEAQKCIEISENKPSF